MSSTTTKSGAEALAERIEAYWRGQAFVVRAIPVECAPGMWTVFLPDLDPATAMPRRGTPRVQKAA